MPPDEINSDVSNLSIGVCRRLSLKHNVSKASGLSRAGQVLVRIIRRVQCQVEGWGASNRGHSFFIDRHKSLSNAVVFLCRHCFRQRQMAPLR